MLDDVNATTHTQIHEIHVEDGAVPLLTCLGLKLQRRSGSTGYGPFINLENFSVGYGEPLAAGSPNGVPYIYIPATAPPNVITQANRFVANVPLSSVTPANAPLYNYAAIPYVPPTFSTQYMRVSDMQTIMGSSSQPTYTGPYLLWASGADGQFGFANAGQYAYNGATPKTDDVTNFMDQIPSNLKQ